MAATLEARGEITQEQRFMDALASYGEAFLDRTGALGQDTSRARRHINHQYIPKGPGDADLICYEFPCSLGGQLYLTFSRCKELGELTIGWSSRLKNDVRLFEVPTSGLDKRLLAYHILGGSAVHAAGLTEEKRRRVWPYMVPVPRINDWLVHVVHDNLGAEQSPEWYTRRAYGEASMLRRTAILDFESGRKHALQALDHADALDQLNKAGASTLTEYLGLALREFARELHVLPIDIYMNSRREAVS